ncbi:MAG: PQQ-like beta-propeller repeat protein [Myxococcaceae bacterium]|nr:PQQ-like beta-propeller repeat protein [Myxococcaceae bacterium]
MSWIIAANNQLVYVGSGSGALYAVEAQSGLPVWEFNSTGLLPSLVSAAAVSEGIIYFTSKDGYLYALDSLTGDKLWSSELNAWLSSPVVDGGMIYVGSMDGSLYAVNASTGLKSWSFPTPRPLFSSPAVDQNVIYVTSMDQRLYAVDAVSRQGLWSVDLQGTGGSPIVAHGAVYVALAEEVLAFNAANGTLHWGFSSGVSFGRPTLENDRVFIFGSNRTLFALDDLSGEEEWQLSTNTDTDFLLPPTVLNSTLYLPISGALLAFNVETREKLWTCQLQGTDGVASAIGDDLIYVIYDYTLYAIKL